MAKEPFIDGVPELILLKLLSQREMYGYELVGEIRRRSQEAFTFGEGCVYPILHRLVTQKCLKMRKEVVDGRTRRYYQLRANGSKRLAHLERTWQDVAKGVAAFGRGEVYANA